MTQPQKPKHNQSRNGSLDKAIRLVLLMKLQDSRAVDGLNHSKILKLLPKKYRPSLVTIGRDLRHIGIIRRALEEIGEGK